MWDKKVTKGDSQWELLTKARAKTQKVSRAKIQKLEMRDL